MTLLRQRATEQRGATCYDKKTGPDADDGGGGISAKAGSPKQSLYRGNHRARKRPFLIWR